MTKYAYRTLAVFLLAFSFGTQAQKGSALLMYGNTIFRKDLLGQLNSKDNYSFGRPMQFAGVSLTEQVLIKTLGVFPSNVLAAHYLPQEFKVNDSVTGNISGSMFGVSLGYDFFKKSEVVGLTFSAGLNIGRLKLVDNQYLHLKNGMFTPKLSVTLSVHVRKLCLAFNAEYVYDVSNSDWKEKSRASKRSASVPVPGLNQSGFNFSVGLGLSGNS
jgi:hypothetical protein